jgi:hypothetical protein
MTLEGLSKTLEALQAAKVEFLIVGGLAVIAHGHTRVTHDLDLVIAMNPENTSRTIATLTRLGFVPRIPVAAKDFCDPDIRQRWIREKGLQVFSLINEELEGFVIDLFAEAPFDFNNEYSKAAFIELPGIDGALPFVSKDSLLKMKESAGRSIDLDDISHLNIT